MCVFFMKKIHASEAVRLINQSLATVEDSLRESARQHALLIQRLRFLTESIQFITRILLREGDRELTEAELEKLGLGN